MAPPSLASHLEQLAELLGDMGDAAVAALARSTTALLENRSRLAEKVVEDDPALDALQARVDDVATDALLFHAPVAGDLRQVVAAIRAADDLERMGDLAEHVARAALRQRPGRVLPAEVRPAFAQMGELGVRLGRKAAEVARTRNVLLAVQLDDDDDAMDALHAQLFEVVMDQRWSHGVTAAVDITLLGRFYERFADHAVLVARETVYAVTGRQPEALTELLGRG